MTEDDAVEIIGFLTRSKAIWTNPELLNLVGTAPSPSQAFSIVFRHTGSQKKAKAARFYAMALRDYGHVSPGTLVAVLQSPQGAEKLEELLTTTSLKHGTGRSSEMSDNTTKNELTEDEAKSLIERVGDRLGCDHTYAPVFPAERNDVCVVKHMTENGSTYGYDTVFLVWKDKSGQIRYSHLRNSKDTKDYIHVNEVHADADGNVTVSYGSGGSYSGNPWNESRTVPVNR